jgi:SHS2 domain-containing protein
MFETFDHTADVGLRIRAANLTELFAEAGRALMSVLVGSTGGPPTASDRIELESTTLEDLLVDWLSELLYRFSVRRRVAVGFEIEVATKGDQARLEATVRSRALDPERDDGGMEVKAVTYHGLKIAATESGYRAEVILDV